MPLPRWFRDHPVALFAVVAAAFGTWVAADLLRPPAQPPAPPPAEEVGQLTVVGPEFLPPTRTVTVVPRTKLPQLRPGMSRVEVEDLLGTPLPEQLSPITVQDGRVTYQTTYPVDLDPVPLNTVREFSHPPRPPAPRTVPTTILTLEFDASRPGHPLLRYQYPDPLF